MVSYSPRLVISALRGGSGKTLISMGLAALFKEKGYNVAVFKKGPDFIDPNWLSLATGNRCFNLDPFLMDKREIVSSFVSNSLCADISIVEGNRGLYDGMDLEGKYSTAELAKLIGSPLILILDVAMRTRTVAAILKGCQVFDTALNIKGVILNKVAGPRQEKLIRDCIRLYCDIPVVGSIPKLRENLLKERHMGLVPYQEREEAERVIDWAKGIVKEHLDIQRITEMAKDALPVKMDKMDKKIDPKNEQTASSSPVRIGFFLDRAFWFYYPENLDALKERGAELVRIDALRDREVPDVDAIYIGGGFPETQAEFLARNEPLKRELRDRMEKGLPVYAECGGFMYLGESLFLDGKEYPMVGFLPIRFYMEKRPQGHGYTIMEVCRPNPFFRVKEVIKGHEFHYSRPYIVEAREWNFAFKVNRGRGIDQKQDGICKKNVLATYTHIHVRGNRQWPEAIIKVAGSFKQNMPRP